MKEIAHDAPARSIARGQRHLWVAATLLLFSCGGKSVETPASTAGSGSEPMGDGGSAASSGGAPSASGASGRTEPAVGGDPNDVGPYITIEAGGKIGAAGAADLGAGAPTMACESRLLMKAIVRGSVGGFGTCQFAPPPGDGEKLDRARGAVVLDREGRVIDNTGLNPTAKQAWLEELMDQRWPCLAGQTLGYTCRPAS
jgi:hypothetical protein